MFSKNIINLNTVFSLVFHQKLVKMMVLVDSKISEVIGFLQSYRKHSLGIICVVPY